jgi:hypothetical protein
MSKFVHGVKHLIRELIPPAAFFFVAFQLLAFTEALMLRQYGIEVTAFLEATIGALVAAKVVLLSNLLPFINRFPGRPLIYNIAWKTPIYFAVAFGVRYLEELFRYYHQHGELTAANRHLLDEIIWPHFWAIQIWLLLLLLIYCALDEMVRALGHDRMRELFLGVSRKAERTPNLKVN